MFVATPVDPSLSPIRYGGTPGPSVPVRDAVTSAPSDAAYRTQRGHLLTFAGIALAAAVAGFGAGAALSSGSAPDAGGGRAVSVRPVPGEFRLAPGLAQPPGIVVPVSTAGGPARGEFRLGPGLAQ